MNAPHLSIASVLVLATLSIAVAQNDMNAPTGAKPQENAPADAQTSGSGTSPNGMGSTGWTGGTRGDNTGTTETAAGQPLTATGVDLKGPPTRFPPSQTPE